MQQPASNSPTDPTHEAKAHEAKAHKVSTEQSSQQKAAEGAAKQSESGVEKGKKQAAGVASKKAKKPATLHQMSDEDEVDAQSLTVVIGRRLALIREELGQHRPGNSLSQSQVAKESGLTQNMIWRLERGLSRNDGLLKLLRYYEQHGYNISWILTEQNFAVSKLLVQQLTVNVDSNYLRLIHRQVEKVVGMQEKAVQAMSDLQALLQDMKSGK